MGNSNSSVKVDADTTLVHHWTSDQEDYMDTAPFYALAIVLFYVLAIVLSLEVTRIICGMGHCGIGRYKKFGTFYCVRLSVCVSVRS